MYQRNPIPRSDNGPAEDGQLPSPGHVGDLEVGGNLDVAGEVGKQKVGYEAGDRRADGEAVQAVRKVDGVRRPHDDEGRKKHIPPSQVWQDCFEKRDRYAGVEPGFDVEGDADKQRDGDFRRQPDLSRHPPAVLLGELPVVVDKADQTEPERDHDHEPDVTHGQVGPEQRGDGDREDDEDAAHRRRTLLGKVGIRPVFPDGLADLEVVELADQPGGR